MKKYLLINALILLVSCCIPSKSEAQFITRKVKDSMVNAGGRTITFPYTPTGVVSIGLGFKVGTGTPAGSATLQTRLDTVVGSWVAVTGAGTFTITGDSAVYIWPVSPHYGNGYRIVITSSGTQKTYLYASYLRR